MSKKITYSRNDPDAITRVCCIRCHTEMKLVKFNNTHESVCAKRDHTALLKIKSQAKLLNNRRNNPDYKPKQYSIGDMQVRVKKPKPVYVEEDMGLDLGELWYYGPYYGIPIQEVPTSYLMQFVRENAGVKSIQANRAIGELTNRMKHGQF